ncbi:hypothetical protein BEWA_033180 [Theileria equi strain WA]|uniref:UBX domain-containing protein n=1 Tax=Theileria equi strain WA TaxID=1537102 RepID=L0AY34_THEEQ|nr:hypothetical protein BEWA_033180 [Theileria equi strain WA]AFZ80465.1 hypothetical protein BEWA_033180 [Theileria equi strain WA]|eukprot:XP_004830131.1 hypothetical protein BEWA_033180 [Theileria equi strain WA]
MSSLYDTAVSFFNETVKKIFEPLQSLLRRACTIIGIYQPYFLEFYESKYGSTHPKLFSGTFEEAKAEASNTGKLLLVYIHSDRDQRFCSELLSNKLVIEVLDSNFIVFIEYHKGPHMRRLINITNALLLPHVSIMACKTPTETRIIDRIEGFVDYDKFISILVNAVDNADGPISSLESSRKLREEQDEEFRKAVEIDSMKMMEKENDVRRRNTQAAIKKEKEEKIKRIVHRRKQLAVEHKHLEAKGNTKIRVRLPTGHSIESLFDEDDTIEKVYQWVEASEYMEDKDDSIKIPYDFVLSIPHPSQALSNKSQTLKDANLVPNASILLTSLCDDSDED